MSRPKEAIAVYDEVIKRFGDPSEPEMRDLLAMAMIRKGEILSKMNHPANILQIKR